MAQRYRLDRVIAVGGMGVLFEGRDVQTQRSVAVKLLRPCYENDPERDARLLREAVLARDLRHPNVVTVLDFGHDDQDGAGYIAMELLAGVSLEDELRARGRLPAAEVLALLFPVLGAVALAHDRGVVHRDLKPSNIFLAHGSSSSDTPAAVAAKVLDFGIAKSLVEASWHTRSGVTLGTPEYMSPEHARGEAAQAASDVWALGVVLYRALSGQMPFAGSGSAVLYQVLHEPPVPLEKVVPPGTSHLAIAVERALARDLGTRYRDARELARGLLWGAVQDGLEVPLDPDPQGLWAWRSWHQQALHTADATLAAPPAARAVRRRRFDSRLRAVLASAAAAASLWVAASTSDGSTRPLAAPAQVSTSDASAAGHIAGQRARPAPRAPTLVPSAPLATANTNAPPAGTAVSAASEARRERVRTAAALRQRVRAGAAAQAALLPAQPLQVASAPAAEPEIAPAREPVARNETGMLPW